MKKQFTYEFEVEKENRITYEYSPEADEKLDSLVENGVPIVYLNRSAMLMLAKTLIKMALGSYTVGFHVHLSKDLNADLPDRLTVMLYDGSDDTTGNPDESRSEIKSTTTILPPR